MHKKFIVTLTDQQIAEAYSCRVQTVESVRKRFCIAGFDDTVSKKREHVPRGPKLDGEQEAKVIALRLGPAPDGYANWTLRLLQRKVVELSIVDSISPETLRKSLKKSFVSSICGLILAQVNSQADDTTQLGSFQTL